MMGRCLTGYDRYGDPNWGKHLICPEFHPVERTRCAGTHQNLWSRELRFYTTNEMPVVRDGGDGFDGCPTFHKC